MRSFLVTLGSGTECWESQSEVTRLLPQPHVPEHHFCHLALASQGTKVTGLDSRGYRTIGSPACEELGGRQGKKGLMVAIFGDFCLKNWGNYRDWFVVYEYIPSSVPTIRHCCGDQ